MNRYWMIQIEGIDKTGKDLLCNYIGIMSNHKYIPYSRGIISLLSYNEIYNRKQEYEIRETVGKNWVFVYLYGYDKDIEIRCKINNEEFRGIDEPVFKQNVDLFEQLGYKVFRYNVSKMTYFDIANDIISKMEDLNNGYIL